MSTRAKGRRQARRAAHARGTTIELWTAADQAAMEALVDPVRRAETQLAELLLAPAPSETLPEENPSPEAPVTEQPTRSDRSVLRWEATFVPEGKLTSDGRSIAPGTTKWRELPLSLMAMTETSEGGHIGAELSGRIDEIWRGDSFKIMARGVFDSGDYGSEIGRLVGEETLGGLSVDLAIDDLRFVPKDRYFTEDGIVENWQELLAEDDAAGDQEIDLLDVLFGTEEDMVLLITDSTIGMATVCPFPAFEGAEIHLLASGHRQMTLTFRAESFEVWAETVSGEEAETVLGKPGVVAGEIEESAGYITAAAAGLVPLEPPTAWFMNPNFEEPMPLTVTDEGQVYGHAAVWDVCHIGIPGTCTTAPSSPSGYTYFHLKEVQCDGGERLPCGTITLDTGHARPMLGKAEAISHYDDTGLAVADVRVGEDAHGIWIAGALRPDMDAERIRDLRAAVISGDWRNVGGYLELVALLAVNVPGFPVPRKETALIAAGDDGNAVLSLVATGIFGVEEEEDTEALLIEVERLGKEATS